MPLLLHGTSTEVTQLILSVFSLISMAAFIALCGRCRTVAKRAPADADVYGVVNPAATIAAHEATSLHCVQFRQAETSVRGDAHHSQPTAKSCRCGFENVPSRASAPLQLGRALPRVPTDAYTDDGCHPMYECIGPDRELIVGQTYSKISESSPHREPRYDYPVFSVKDLYAVPTTHDERCYQSASQVYTLAGSDDPYSSIVSEPRRNNGDADVAGTSAANANIEPEISDSTKRREDAEINEQEIDQLYSTVRRPSLRNIDCDSSIAGPSHVCLEDARIDAQHIPRKSIQHGDEESNSSQEPSYRYITVRENAHVIRERLRQQGQLTAPARDHYYSVIGNEYETVGDAQNSTYNTLSEPQTSGTICLDLNISRSREFVPPPPTSPIPDRSLNSDNKGECSGESTFSSLCRCSTINGVIYAIVTKPKVIASMSAGSQFEGTHESISHSRSSI